jgi:hypothetical protein
MSGGFELFGNDLMQALSLYIHCGQTAAWLDATCKRLYHLVHNCKRLKMLMRYHVINTDIFNQNNYKMNFYLERLLGVTLFLNEVKACKLVEKNIIAEHVLRL